jgi:hypothetical protein
MFAKSKLTSSVGVFALSCGLMAQDITSMLVAQNEVPLDVSPLTEATIAADEPVAAFPKIVTSTKVRPTSDDPKGLEAIASFADQRFGYVLHGSAQAQYDSNIFIQSEDEQSDLIFTISPGVAFGIGDFKDQLAEAGTFRYRFERFADTNFLYVDYSPSYVAFVDHSEQNSFDQDVKLIGEYHFSRLTVGVRGGYSRTNEPSADIGTRVENSHISGAVTTRYEYSGKTTLEANFYYDNQRFEDNGDQPRENVSFVNTQEFRTEEWMNYQFLPKTNLGVGVAGGYLERSEGPSETYERVQFRLLWEASSKLTLSLVAGPELRQRDSTGGSDDTGDDEVNGVTELHASWNPSDGTYFHLQGYRTVQPSGTVGESFTATGGRLQYRQRLFTRYFLDVSGGYERSDYSGYDGSPARHDDLYFGRSSVGFGLTRNLSCEVVGEYRNNNSSMTDRGFQDTSAKVVLNVLF